MHKLTTKKTAVSVDSFLDKVANAEQRADAYTVVELMKDLTGEEPRMWGPSIVGFGEYHYVYESGHEGDTCLTGFSPRKAALTIYFYAGFAQDAALLKKLGKCKTSKGCLYVKKLADIDLAILRQMIETNITRIKKLITQKANTTKKPSKKK